ALHETRIAMFGNGEETRDHLYVDDAVALFMQTLVHRSTGLLNLASGQSASFREVAEQIIAHLGGPIELQSSKRQNPVTHRRFDITNLNRAFPDTTLTPLSDGLRKTVDAMREQADG